MHMPTLRHATLPILLLTLDLCAQQGSPEPVGVAEVFNTVTYSSAADSVDFAAFKERTMSKGASYTVPSRSRGYRMVWYMHVENFNCTITRGDGRTLKEFLADPSPGYATNGEKPTGYGSRCAEVRMSKGNRRSAEQGRWYFEAP